MYVVIVQPPEVNL